MFRNATIYLSEIIVVCKKINVPLKYIGYFGKACLPFIPSKSSDFLTMNLIGMLNSWRKHSTVNDRSSSRRAKPDFFNSHGGDIPAGVDQNWVKIGPMFL